MMKINQKGRGQQQRKKKASKPTDNQIMHRNGPVTRMSFFVTWRAQGRCIQMRAIIKLFSNLILRIWNRVSPIMKSNRQVEWASAHTSTTSMSMRANSFSIKSRLLRSCSLQRPQGQSILFLQKIQSHSTIFVCTSLSISGHFGYSTPMPRLPTRGEIFKKRPLLGRNKCS